MTATPTERMFLTTPKGHPANFWYRPGTNDFNTVTSILTDDEYGIAALDVSGWAIDIGSHVGAWSIAIALDNPGVQVVAVEAVPENVELIKRNVAENELGERVHVLEAGATTDAIKSISVPYGYDTFEGHDKEYVRGHRFVGGQYREHAFPTEHATPEAMGLRSILDRFQIDEVAVLKTDCEGCEWNFLTSKSMKRVVRITGEFHAGYGGDPDAHEHGGQDIRTILAATHDVISEDVPVGLFTAMRR